MAASTSSGRAGTAASVSMDPDCMPRRAACAAPLVSSFRDERRDIVFVRGGFDEPELT
jgi:uncharacterized protein GlcG (DUF336 family)